MKNMKLSTKVLIMVLASNLVLAIVLSLVAISGTSKQGNADIEQFKVDGTDLIKQKLEEVTDLAYTTLEYYKKMQEDGAVDLETAKTMAKNHIKNLMYDDGRGYFWINDMSEPYSKMIMHSVAPQLDGKILDNPKYDCAMGNNENLFSAMVRVCKKDGKGFVDYVWPDPKDKSKTLPKLSYVKLYKEWGWVVGTGVYIDDIDKIVEIKKETVASTVKKNTMFNLIITIVLITISVILGLMFTNMLKKRMGEIAENLKDISHGDGDLTKRLDESSNDEIAEIAHWFNIFVEKLQSMIKDIASDSTILAESAKQLSETSSEIAATAEETSAQSQTVASASEQASANVSNISESTEELSNNANSVATAIEEMSATISEVAQNCQKESQIATEAVDQARSTQTIMNELGVSAQEIGKIVETINDIADQTNLLALNATIEAASAGDAGKGFAVVASEVKELARQTAEATEEIRNQVEGMQNRSGSAVDAITKITGTIEELNSISQTIVSAVEEQSSATNEISKNVASTSTAADTIASNVSQTASGLNEVASNIQSVNEASQNTASGVTEVTMNAERMNELSDKLQGIVNQFKV